MNEYLKEIVEERQNQDKKWGEQNHSPLLWLSIIGEEYGEMCKEANEFGFSNDLQRISDLKTEAIQCAACCIAMIESIDRNILNKTIVDSTGISNKKKLEAKGYEVKDFELSNENQSTRWNPYAVLKKLGEEDPTRFKIVISELQRITDEIMEGESL